MGIHAEMVCAVPFSSKVCAKKKNTLIFDSNLLHIYS